MNFDILHQQVIHYNNTLSTSRNGRYDLCESLDDCICESVERYSGKKFGIYKHLYVDEELSELVKTYMDNVDNLYRSNRLILSGVDEQYVERAIILQKLLLVMLEIEKKSNELSELS